MFATGLAHASFLCERVPKQSDEENAMTFQPPPPPPPPGGPPPPPGGQPPGYGPPPPGAQPPGYGAPPPPGNPYGAPGGSPYGAPGPGFDPKSVNPLDWGIIAAGVLAFIFSIVSFYKAKV
ncbi:MAG: hypothetical protein QOF95_496, partial [Pseudonocardiales bacterium]|nr:hypothetical protein [Pseudonocardiales bacterium]